MTFFTYECRRDSFITHRAFCDALARESAQIPPIGAGLYVGSGGMSLGLSGAAAQMHGFADQGQSSSAAVAAQFDHIMPSSSGPSMFRSQASASSSSFFLGGGGAPSPAQDFSEDGEGGQGSSLLHGKSPFHGLMQLPEQQHNGQPGSSNANGNLLNLSFFSGNGGGSAGGQDARIAMQDQFNAAAGGSNAEHGGVMASMGSHLSAGFPSSLYNSSPSAALPQNSATALLMKAAQMGSTSTSTHNHNGPNALLRAVGFSASSGGQGTSRAAGEGTTSHEAHFHDLIMNSLTGGGGGFSGVGAGFGAVDDGKLSTRDFLGVGRGSMAPPGLHIGALDPAQMK